MLIIVVEITYFLGENSIGHENHFWKSHFRKSGSSCSKAMQKSCTQGGTSDYVTILDYLLRSFSHDLRDTKFLHRTRTD